MNASKMIVCAVCGSEFEVENTLFLADRLVCSLECQDHLYVQGLTGNCPVSRDTAAALGLSVQDRVKSLRFRNLKDMLTFPQGEEREAREWLKERFKTLSGYTEALLGAKGSKQFLATFKKLMSDPDQAHLYVNDLLGVPREKIEPASSVRPGKAWYQEHKLDGELLCHQADDGAMPDDRDPKWIQDENGNWRMSGFSIPYLRRRVEINTPTEFGFETKVESQVVEVQTYRGPMKVLNICYCAGEAPSLQYKNLVLAANEEGLSTKQQVIARQLISKYRKAMTDRDSSIKTCRNGKISVYYKAYLVDGKKVCVFSPIPFDDLSDEAKKRYEEQQERYKLWNDSTLVQDL